MSVGKKKMRKVAKQVTSNATMLFRGLVNHVRGRRPLHLVIAGFSRSGTTLLYNMIRHSAVDSVYAPEHEISALKTARVAAANIVTKRPLDIFCVSELQSTIGRYRDLKFLISLRDPRDLVSSRHRSVSNQFFQGYDYQFFIGSHGNSFTNPGIGAVHRAIQAIHEQDVCQLSVKYEDLVEDPERVRQILKFATGIPLNAAFQDFHKGDIPTRLQSALNDIRPVCPPSRPAWSEGDRLARAMQQIYLFPQIEQMISEWGYPSTDEMIHRYGLRVPPVTGEKGTIIAFHTDDHLYTREAERLVGSLRKLNLKHEIVVVPPRGQWVENCAMKPGMIADARKRLPGPLLYIDVDAVVHCDPWPYLSLYDGDVAAYVHSSGELMSGTVLVRDTVGARKLLDAWVVEQEKAPHDYDQRVLQRIVARKDGQQVADFSFQRLPPNMTWVFDKSYSHLAGDIVVEHLQASRETQKPGSCSAMRRQKRLEEIISA